MCTDSSSEGQYIGTMTWLDRLFGRSADAPRLSGEPQSGNGASSFHLWWEVPSELRFTKIAATLEVVDEPIVDRLVFWALQVSFVQPGGGGAHLGLQHHPRFPASSAANWGGYAPPGEGDLLEGSQSPLPSTPNDPNTRDFVAALDHPQSACRVTAERALLAELDGSCRTPIAAHAEIDATGGLTLTSLVVLPDGSALHKDRRQGSVARPAELGQAAGEALKAAAGPAFFAKLAGG